MWDLSVLNYTTWFKGMPLAVAVMMAVVATFLIEEATGTEP